MHSGRRCSLQQNTARKQFAHSMFRVGGEDEEEVEQQKQSLMNDEFPSEGNPQDDSVAGTADHLAINTDTTSSITESSNKGLLRSRSNNVASEKKKLKRPCSGSRRSPSMTRTTTSSNSYTTRFWYCFCHNAPSCASMQCMATALLWLTVLSLLIATVWYSYELFNHGTDPHLIAWFSAGAFVLLGFPVSMRGILGHLMNYNAPHIQVYIVRILWMVPIYSVESWLAMRFHKKAVLIETARDVYESFVLYCFLQFLIQVLGGEEALVLMLKDKSPTRGVHMWGLQWCGVKPWLMGQPVRRYDESDNEQRRGSVVERFKAVMSSPATMPKRSVSSNFQTRVQWISPFFIQCKFGVLQYVLLKLLCAIAVLLLEWKGWYREGQFHWKAGYLYICILTNVSQCWALYCLIFFYYATKTELSPIRPVGKFLSVKALVFFTWWQSVLISVLYQMDMIPTYNAAERDWSSDDVAKGIQDYLICVEMFIAAVVHTVVFPHADYSVAAVRARADAIHQRPVGHRVSKRLGRRRKQQRRSSTVNLLPSQSGMAGLELISLMDDDATADGSVSTSAWDEPPSLRHGDGVEDAILLSHGNDYDNANHGQTAPGLFRAFMDSAIPRDLRDNTVNIMRGEYHVEKKTLLHHAATSDQYDLFARSFTAKQLQKKAKDDSAS